MLTVLFFISIANPRNQLDSTESIFFLRNQPVKNNLWGCMIIQHFAKFHDEKKEKNLGG